MTCLRAALFVGLSWALLSSPLLNIPVYEVRTNYLQWSSTLPSFSVCPAPPAHRLSGKEGFLENLVRPRKKYCLNCKNTTAFPQNNYRKIAKMRTPACEELFAGCSWNGNRLGCCSAFRFLPTPGGGCYSINSEMTGSRYKLEVSHYAKKGEIFFTTRKDIQVYLHDPKEIGLNEQPSFAVRQSQSLEVIFRFRETVAEDSAKLISSYRRGCVLVEELAEYPLYSQSMCILRCLANEQAKMCGCLHHLLPMKADVPDCNITGLKCLDKKLGGMGKEKKLQKKCHCLPSCEEMDISLVWQNLSRNYNKLRQVKFSIISPPSEKGFLRSRYQLVDAIVMVACLSRLFTSISLYDVWSLWNSRKQQKNKKLNQFDSILL